MSSLTIRNVDEGLKQRIRVRAARNGRSMEEELRTVLRLAFEEKDAGAEDAQVERQERVRKMLSYGRDDPEPFDLKVFSDSLSDGSE